jgi:guanosine-3',5'-bis(diphosphate) 3'-pyrophosphohydrolase
MSEALPLIFRALDFAARKHRDQRRKDASATPYINHPIQLAEVLANEAGVRDPTVLAAAILHDTIEDTETSAGELRAEFGDDIASIVEEVSDDKTLKKEVRKRLQIEHASTRSPGARLVKLADKICNLRDMHSYPPADWSEQRRREYFDWAAAVIDEIRGTHPVLEKLFDEAYARRPG